MKKLMSLFLCIIMLTSLVACGGNSGETTPAEFVPVTDGAVVGKGATTFPLSITDKDGNTINITVNTDKEVVGEALMELGIVEGTQGQYGLYVTHVNGIPAIYEEDATYWAFYINGEYALTGLDQTPIAEGESYMLKVEK